MSLALKCSINNYLAYIKFINQFYQDIDKMQQEIIDGNVLRAEAIEWFKNTILETESEVISLKKL